MHKLKPIQFHFLEPCNLSNRNGLKGFIVSIFKKEKTALNNLSIVFCDDKYLLGLNRQFLNHDFYTDILSFPLSDAGQPLVAEIYISIDRIRENAYSNLTTIKEELHRVIFHGVLHFCGYKDKSANDVKTMRLMEHKYLRNYFK